MQRLKDSVNELNKIFQSKEVNLDIIDAIINNNNRLHDVYGVFMKYFGRKDNMLAMLLDMETTINSIKNNPLLRDVYTLCRRNIHLNIDLSLPGFAKTIITVHVPLTIRYGMHEEQSIDNMKSAMSTLLQNVRKYKSVERFYSQLTRVIDHVLRRIFTEHTELFTQVFGSKIRFELFLDVEGSVDASGWVFEYITKVFQGKNMYISRYDPAFKMFEVNVSSIFLNRLINDGDEDSFINTFIHEFNHLLDKNLPKYGTLNLIRIEGITTFSEWIFRTKPSARYDMSLISELWKNPIKSEKSYTSLLMQGDNPGVMLPYYMGCYMVTVIYLSLLSKNTETRGLLNPNLRVDNPPSLDVLLNNPKAVEIGQMLIRQIRNMTTKQFFTLYLEREQIAPIIIKDLIKDL